MSPTTVSSGRDVGISSHAVNHPPIWPTAEAIECHIKFLRRGFSSKFFDNLLNVLVSMTEDCSTWLDQTWVAETTLSNLRVQSCFCLSYWTALLLCDFMKGCKMLSQLQCWIDCWRQLLQWTLSISVVNTIQFCRQKYCFLCWAGRTILLCAYCTIYCTRNVFIGYFCLITLIRVYFSSGKNYCVLAVSELIVDLLFMWCSL